MLVLGAHNVAGNVLHVVMGPESELHMDIHGANILDITPILARMREDQKVFLSVTRCRSEQQTSTLMATAKVPFNSTVPSTPDTVPSSPDGATTLDSTPVTAKETCQYCKGETDLLPVSGFKVCGSCAAIELGRRIKPAKKE